MLPWRTCSNDKIRRECGECVAVKKVWWKRNLVTTRGKIVQYTPLK